MRHGRIGRILFSALLLSSASAAAADIDPASPDKETQPSTMDVPDVLTPQTTASPAIMAAENTLEACSDGIDNDGDGLVDCADPDCAIFVRCLTDPSRMTPMIVIAQAARETGALCRDGLDNDGDGLVDCHDPDCRSTRYCRRIMYERPERPERAPGVFLQLGMGMALPNWHWKDVRVDSRYGNGIPFDPDMGGMGQFKVGVAPLRYLGVGVNLFSTSTFATNRHAFLSLSDPDDRYRYVGYKASVHVGGFVRLQYPVGRVMPYVDLMVGYSAARYRWRVYNSDVFWSDIEEYMDRPTDGPEHQTVGRSSHHFSLMLEPGFSVFVLPRFLGIGTSLLLPVISGGQRGTDNIGVLFHATLTPNWREPRQLRSEYRQ